MRQEVTGKHIYIGIYQQDIIVPQLPYVLERLFLLTRIRAPIDHPRPKEINVRVEVPGQPEQSFKLPATVPSRSPEALAGAMYWDLSFVLPVRLSCTEEGRIRVKVETDVGSAYAGGISIKTSPGPDSGDIIDLEALNSVLFQFTNRLSAQSRPEKRKVADALLDILTLLTGGKIKADVPHDALILAPLSRRSVVVMFNSPISSKPKLAVTHNSIPLKHTVRKGNAYYCIVELDPSGPELQAGISIELAPFVR